MNTQDKDAEVVSTPTIKMTCSVPPAPQNIWKLEPMLKQKGLINDAMSKEEKERIIRGYIRKKNSVYMKCAKGK